jgi:FkbM family methyltransferase
VVARLLKRVASRLPESVQHDLRRRFFSRQIRAGTFTTDEREYLRLSNFLREGDWALDVGANVGHYTRRMSELVGTSGRVVAFEPVPETFSLLVENARLFPHQNVTLLNVAVSDSATEVGMHVPTFDVGLRNYYQARVADDAALRIVAISIDTLELPGPVRLVKMDVEGHELPALRGMRRLIERDRPVLIVETGSEATIGFVAAKGYSIERLPGSANVLCRPLQEAHEDAVTVAGARRIATRPTDQR